MTKTFLRMLGFAAAAGAPVSSATLFAEGGNRISKFMSSAPEPGYLLLLGAGVALVLIGRSLRARRETA